MSKFYEREPYWDYMGRKLSESEVMSSDNLYKREVFELQKSLQQSLIRQKELLEQAYALKRKVTLLGGDEKQLEMDL
mgnify:CR=1 FL=1